MEGIVQEYQVNPWPGLNALLDNLPANSKRRIILVAAQCYSLQFAKVCRQVKVCSHVESLAKNDAGMYLRVVI